MKALLIGSILGDGYLEPYGKGVRLQVNHAVRAAPYIAWKRNELMELQPSPLHRNHNNGYPFWRFVTRRHPQLAELREMFYPHGTKIVPDGISEMLKHPLTLAVWFMDDGTMDKRQGSMLFETQCFDEAGVEKLQVALASNFGISTTAHRCGVNRKGRRIYVPVAQSRKLRAIIEPYVVPVMRYKLAFPVTTDGKQSERSVRPEMEV